MYVVVLNNAIQLYDAYGLWGNIPPTDPLEQLVWIGAQIQAMLDPLVSAVASAGNISGKYTACFLLYNLEGTAYLLRGGYSAVLGIIEPILGLDPGIGDLPPDVTIQIGGYDITLTINILDGVSQLLEDGVNGADNVINSIDQKQEELCCPRWLR